MSADEGPRHNERLEFLGDAVLSLIISDYLADDTLTYEGGLSKLKARLVSEPSLAKAAKRLNWGLAAAWKGRGTLEGTGKRFSACRCS